MATERQIAANRANAQRSTGPRTASGKMKSSRNAFRHGLSRPLPPDHSTSSTIKALAGMLMPQGASAEQWCWAVAFATAVHELVKLRAIRANMLLPVGYEMDTQMLKDLVSLDRYERYAHTRRRRAAANLSKSAQ
jgi:hypothetical protein